MRVTFLHREGKAAPENVLLFANVNHVLAEELLFAEIEFAFGEKRPLSIFMEVGILEGEYSWKYPDWPHQIVSHRHFKTVLDMRGYEVKYQEYAGGHEMLSWRGGVAEGLKYLLGNAAGH